ncbi:hypothetical protein [Rhizobium lusitanum]|uniref:Uncharacterized protein n=1 Tax=Rhizobium lusitanum TaxID=293958 RepID=A0A7X0IW86_9HYPH|nr:hypothetical protein [Rhizobium lusitanum]MBB6486856.1 hypothetical protein [Rhizobium lusitanum]
MSANVVHRAEIKYIENKDVGTKTLADNTKLAGALADQYITLSDQASSAQDIAALGIIASAGVAAGGMLYDANLNLIKGAGLAAGTLTASSTYFKPGETSSALLDAAEQMICLRKAGEPYLAKFGNDPQAGEILKGGILTVRLNLRKRLNRTLPDYRNLVENLKASLQQAPAGGVHGLSDEENLSLLRASVASCVLPGS